VQRFSIAVGNAGDYRFCFRAPTWVQAELRDANGASLQQVTNRNGAFFNNPEFVQTLAAGTYTFDVFSRESATASFDVIWRPAAEAHAACQ